MGVNEEEFDEEDLDLIEEFEENMEESERNFRDVVQEKIASKNNWTIIDTECWTWTSQRCLYGTAVFDAGSEYKAFIVKEDKPGRLKVEPLASIPKSIRIKWCNDCWYVIDNSSRYIYYNEHYFYEIDGLIRYFLPYIHVPARSQRIRAVLRQVFYAIAEKNGACPCGSSSNVDYSFVTKWFSWDDIKRLLAEAYCYGDPNVEYCVESNMDRRLIVIIPKDDLPGMSATIYAELHGTPPKAYAILMPASTFKPEEDESVLIDAIHVFSLDFRYHRVLKDKRGYYAVSLKELKNRKDTALYILPDVHQVMKEG